MDPKQLAALVSSLVSQALLLLSLPFPHPNPSASVPNRSNLPLFLFSSPPTPLAPLLSLLLHLLSSSSHVAASTYWNNEHNNKTTSQLLEFGQCEGYPAKAAKAVTQSGIPSYVANEAVSWVVKVGDEAQ
ncbi:hypothetical protein C4D60_Mb09t00910 [Musa balbisiana]|uniref:Uncharacterized protein n=1 Tax=Musa balbisiana TaxID=52838 RepID=A0A4S8ID37_MUSBA|nr:hypothetical protein C4D60_Mb09t00910 [Musa balbisiana]